MENPPLQSDNRVYTLMDLKPRLIANLQNYFKKLKLKIYKKRKVNEYKTIHQRYYYMKFKVHIEDDINPQLGKDVYEMIVPAQAAFFAKILLERNIREKLTVEVVYLDEMSGEEHSEYQKSVESYEEKK